MQSINEVPSKLSAICISPVELPYVPILLNETFTKALWDTEAEKSFTSEEAYRKYFFYKQVKKSRAQHEIDTGNKPPVSSRPYRYDRVKQAILDYHVDKMLKKGTIIPIQSLYASPVVLCRKNNGLPPDNPEAYRFVVDYRKIYAITKYPRYPFPLIGTESIRRGQDGHNESGSFKIAGFQKAFRVIYGCMFNRCGSGSKSGADTSSVCFSHA
ncbi:retrovirus-related Pol polyprotein from transposon 17.6 [Trichonephila clavipes]|nr:retrovirus-related Pol polyprotein from transposon 17.6 [Trichonephila clavipes]